MAPGSSADVARGKYRIEVWSPRLQEPGQMLQREDRRGRRRSCRGAKSRTDMHCARRSCRSDPIPGMRIDGGARRHRSRRHAGLLRWRWPVPRATDWDASLDLRLVAADAPTSLLDGGLGVVRYGDDRDGVQLGRARLALSQDLGDLLTFKARCVGLGPARPQSGRCHRGLSATASLSDRRVARAREAGRLLRTAVTGESRRRLGIAVHAVILRDGQLGGAGTAHHRHGIQTRVAGHPFGTRL